MVDLAPGEPSPTSRGRLPGALEVQSILHPPEPIEQDGSSPTKAGGFVMSPSSALSRTNSSSSRQSLARTLSNNDPARQSKRLSVTLPIQSSGPGQQSRGPPSPIRTIAPPTTIPESLTSPTGPTDSNFLTALATQERRVLELREELARAEQNLKKLKRDWALHEAQKKRHDAKRVQKMRPLSATSLPSPTSQTEQIRSSALRTQEMERRRALLAETKASTRTTFSSRHARTLSLLTPSLAPPPPPSQEQSVGQAAFEQHKEPVTTPTPVTRPPMTSRASTDPDLTREVVVNADENIDLGLPRDVLIKTGRQMASDFKDGLWTFIEDLRQATVGEEGVNGTKVNRSQSNRSAGVPAQRTPRDIPKTAVRQPQRAQRHVKSVGGKGKGSTRSPYRKSGASPDNRNSAGGSFWLENGLEEPKHAETPVVRKTPKKSTTWQNHEQAPSGGNDSWDMWDSPVNDGGKVALRPETGSHDDKSWQARTSNESSRQVDHLLGTPADGLVDQNAIPWPALTKLTPGNLRRTASHLMNEWERSLTPPAEDTHTQTDYLAHTPSPVKDPKFD